jgi:hypothetical protein
VVKKESQGDLAKSGKQWRKREKWLRKNTSQGMGSAVKPPSFHTYPSPSRSLSHILSRANTSSVGQRAWLALWGRLGD